MSETLDGISVSEVVHLAVTKPFVRKEHNFKNKPIPISGHLWGDP